MNTVKDKLNVCAKVLIFAFLLISSTSCSNKKKIEVRNKDGVVIESYFVNKKSPDDKIGTYSKFYDDGKAMEVAEYKDGKLNGKRTLYHPNGKMMQQENYVDNKLEGKLTSYYEDGSLQQEAIYKDNVGEGLWKNYFKEPKNVLNAEITMSNNKINGPFKEYYPNGKLYAKGTKIEIMEGVDSYDGKVEVYDSTGTLDKILTFENGKQISKEEK